jgi:hypothetical protein
MDNPPMQWTEPPLKDGTFLGHLTNEPAFIESLEAWRRHSF